MDPAQADADPIIQDRIQCRGCGRWDDYTFTADAHAEILTESLRLLSSAASEKKTRGSPLVLVSLGLQDGQRMHPEDGLRDYQRRLAEHPDDPGLHIGYANILRFLKRITDAEASYRRALELDPSAAEAHASLAQLAAERGDVPEAARGFARCVRVLPHGHFYKIPEAKREEFVAATREEAERFRVLGRLVGDRVGGGADAASEPRDRGVARPAGGRNAPCPCGSGKKYKKCCLSDQVAEPSAPTPLGVGLRSAADEELSQYLAEFAARVSRRERDRAMALYAEVHPPSAGRAEDVHADAVGFMEWFVNDYPRTLPSNFFRIDGTCSSCIWTQSRRNGGTSVPSASRSITMFTITPPTGIPDSGNQPIKRVITAMGSASGSVTKKKAVRLGWRR